VARLTPVVLSRIFKSQVHRALHATGWQALRRADGSVEIRRLVRLGDDPISDARYILEDNVATVFDVGANNGQTALRFATAFPRAKIYSVEPDPDTFRRLEAAVAHLPAVRPFNVALGRATGEAQLFRFASDETNSLLQKAAGAESYVADAGALREAGSVAVAVTTLDRLCEEQGVARIDLLKLDTQGYELEILHGAQRMLAAGAVGLIYAEVCFVRSYQNQPLFQDVYSFLYERGYRLVALYESGFLTHCYQVGGNALFVHESGGAAKPATRQLRLGSVRFRW
jgi:FkbM family methyltransferase